MVATCGKEVPVWVALQKIFGLFLKKMQKALALERYFSIKRGQLDISP